MKFTLYVELATRIENERILDLFRFPVDATLAPGSRWWSEWWSQGRTRKNQAVNREALLSKLAEAGFNELTLTAKTGPTRPARHPEVTDAWSYTELSPMNILWAPVPEGEIAKISEDRKRFNFAMHGRATPGRHVEYGSGKPEFVADQKPYPTEVQYMVGVEVPDMVGGVLEVQRLCVELIRSATPPALRDLDIFGYACEGGKCRSFGMLGAVGARGGSRDELGEKFENIYPILIGPKASCEGLADTLGEVEKWPLFPDHESPTYILSVPPELTVPPDPRKPDVFPSCASNPAVRRWLVLGNSDKEWHM